MQIPTLYEWEGDMKTFKTMFTLFYGKVFKDNLPEEVFQHMSPQHVKHVLHFAAEVFGSDKLYTT